MKGKCVWKGTILLLCAVGLLKEFRPSGPFLVDYAVDFRNFTVEQMTHDILPKTTYAYIGSLVFLLFVTDILCYKPIIILGGIYTVVTWIITIWFYDQQWKAQLRQVAYGISVVATELAYFTYMYANVEKCDYKRVTSYTHSAVHTGQFLSGLIGQLLITFHILALDVINYLSLGGGVAGLILAFFLPRVLHTVLASKNQDEAPMSPAVENKDKDIEAEESNEKTVTNSKSFRRINSKELSVLQRWKAAPSVAKDNFLYAYTNSNIIKWSIWWVLSYALYIQVDLYVESLWKEIEHHSHQKVFNGAVHCSHALISAILAIGIAHSKMCWITWGCLIFGIGTVLQGAALVYMSQTENLYIAYACFILFQTVFQVLVIVSKFEIAEEIRENSEAFIFGINSLAACLVQAVITFTITSHHGFKLAIREQFMACGGYAVILGLGFLINALPYWKRASWNIGTTEQKIEDKRNKEKSEELLDLSPSMPWSIPREH